MGISGLPDVCTQSKRATGLTAEVYILGKPQVPMLQLIVIGHINLCM